MSQLGVRRDKAAFFQSVQAPCEGEIVITRHDQVPGAAAEGVSVAVRQSDRAVVVVGNDVVEIKLRWVNLATQLAPVS